MKKSYCNSLLSFVLFVAFSSYVYADISLNQETETDDQRTALIQLKNRLDDTGKKLQAAIDLHVHKMDANYEINDEVPSPELNAIVLSQYISEKFFYYCTFLRLFINSYQEGYNDHLNKKLLYHLLTFVTPANEIENFNDILFSKYGELENRQIIEELNRAKDTIASIINEINAYEKILTNSFKKD